jgi:hypothetical protein
MFCDGSVYGTITTNLKNSAINLNVTEATSWKSKHPMAPFDKEVCIFRISNIHSPSAYTALEN